MTSYRPYLLRALTEWINDNGMTPHILVDAGVPGVQVPASAGHLLEYRLGQAGHDAAGFAVAVPHYLADTAYAPAALALLASLAGHTGLSFDTGVLEEAARGVREQVDAQVASSEEVLAVVTALEGQYDAYRAGASRSLLAEMGGGLPTADELGDEFERFLADQENGSAS